MNSASVMMCMDRRNTAIRRRRSELSTTRSLTNFSMNVLPMFVGTTVAQPSEFSDVDEFKQTAILFVKADEHTKKRYEEKIRIQVEMKMVKKSTK